MRLFGFLGLAPLGLVNLLGLMHAIGARDWTSVVLMLGLAGGLVLLAVTLWRGARRPLGSLTDTVAAGCQGARFFTFVREVVAQSLEGRILLLSSVIGWIFAALAAVLPGLVGLAEGSSAAKAIVVFSFWPVLAFVIFVRHGGTDVRASARRLGLTMLTACVPYVLVYV